MIIVYNIVTNFKWRILKMKLRKLLASSLAAMVAASAVAVSASAFEVAGEGEDYKAMLMFTDGSWAWGNWDFDGTTKGADDAAVGGDVVITGDGEYTVSVSRPTADDAADAAGTMVFLVQTNIDGLTNPDVNLEITSIKADGAEIAGDLSLQTLGSEGNEAKTAEALRVEIYNEYGPSKDAPLIDKDSLVAADKIEVTFTVSGLGAAEGAPDETEEGTETTSPETGVEGVVAVAGIAVLAAGVAMVARKRK